ncbi:MAG: hypothetical protein R3C09_28265 [Pirellulaceae bacterium]
MRMSFKSKPTAAALLAISSFGATQLLADDRFDGKFIVQPSRAKPAAVIAAVPQPPPLELASEQAPNARQPTTNIPSPQPAATLARPAPAMASSTSTFQPASSTSSGGLQWIARSHHPEPQANQQSAGALELDNPNFVSPEPAAAASQVPAQSFSAQSFSTQSLPLPTVPSDTSGSTPGKPFSWASERSPAEEDRQSPRAVRASLVSSQIILGHPATDDAERTVESIDNPPGWQAIGEELSGRLENCEALINRKAYFSAREDAEAAMLYLMRVLDLMSNSYRSEPAWYAASKAMSEAEDFSTTQRLTSDSDFLRRVILSHETPVLKDADAATLAPLAAAQHYRQYAEKKLMEAAQGHPWASEVVYALGRSYQAQADLAEVGSQQNLRWRAITLYRGARGIAPNNALATNQLGFVLLQMDRPADAREALVASINVSPSLTAYENLVEASRRIGDVGTANWAMQQLHSVRNSPAAASDTPAYVELDPRTFAAMSPYSVGPSPNRQAQNASGQQFRTTSFSPLGNY